MTDHLMGVYNRAPLSVARGQGAWLWDTEGRQYLDCVAGIATNALGHAHPKLVAALTEQANTLWHVSNIFRVPGQEALAERLTAATFADVVFFASTGTESVECALKTARRYHYAKGAPERIDVIGFAGSFHGRTYGAINAAGNPSYTEGFGPRLPGYVQLNPRRCPGSGRGDRPPHHRRRDRGARAGRRRRPRAVRRMADRAAPPVHRARRAAHL
jgi:acetylornithine/N-succinyldiaminopimelate aminotransferase